MSLAQKPHTSLNPIPHAAWFDIGAHLWATDGAVLVRRDCPQHPDPQQGSGSWGPYHYAQPDDWRDVAALLARCALAATEGVSATAASGLGFDRRFGPLLRWAHEAQGVDSVLCRVRGAGCGAGGGAGHGPAPYRVVISGASGIIAVVAPMRDISVPGCVHWTGRPLPVVWAERAPGKEDSP